jgi:hypothetical protein
MMPFGPRLLLLLLPLPPPLPPPPPLPMAARVEDGMRRHGGRGQLFSGEGG